jgi:hypothetical protein
MCKKAPGKERQACAKSCAKLISGFKAHCRDSKKSCRTRCGKINTGAQCKAGFKKLVKSAETVKGGDKAILKRARPLCKAAASGKASSGSHANTGSGTKGKATDGAGDAKVDKVGKKGKRKVTVADVD